MVDFVDGLPILDLPEIERGILLVMRYFTQNFFFEAKYIRLYQGLEAPALQSCYGY